VLSSVEKICGYFWGVFCSYQLIKHAVG
jgi:hypothetical protein